MAIYPLRFEPLYQYGIRGGNKLKTVMSNEYDGQNIGEFWEISDTAVNETKSVMTPCQDSL